MLCSRCGARLGLLRSLNADAHEMPGLRDKCRETRTERITRERAETAKRAESVVVTTTPTLEGRQIVEYLGIESVEIVIGTGLFVELTGGISDFFGQRSKGFEGKLQNAKLIAFQALKLLAAQKYANAVVGIDLDYTEFTGNRIGLIVNGTLIRTVPIEGIVDRTTQREAIRDTRGDV